jgi:DNA-binding transcriptional ArsR family regulator
MTSKRLLWWLLAGTSGGYNRARIILTLHEMPSNANQLAEQLELDYKTIRHHLDVLLKHEVVVSEGEGYGTLYFVSDDIEASWSDFREIWERIGKKGLKKYKTKDDDT